MRAYALHEPGRGPGLPAGGHQPPADGSICARGAATAGARRWPSRSSARPAAVGRPVRVASNQPGPRTVLPPQHGSGLDPARGTADGRDAVAARAARRRPTAEALRPVAIHHGAPASVAVHHGAAPPQPRKRITQPLPKRIIRRRPRSPHRRGTLADPARRLFERRQRPSRLGVDPRQGPRRPAARLHRRRRGDPSSGRSARQQGSGGESLRRSQGRGLGLLPGRAVSVTALTEFWGMPVLGRSRPEGRDRGSPWVRRRRSAKERGWRRDGAGAACAC